MLKKYLSIFFLFFACSVLIGHGSVPHFHAFDEHDSVHLHGNDHQHEEDRQDKGINHLFAHVVHATGDITYLNSHSGSDSVSKQSVSLVSFAGSPSTFSFDAFNLQKQKYGLARQNPYTSPYFLSSGLRAPPFVIV